MYSDFRQSPEFRNLLAQGGYEFADLGNGCGGIISKIFPIPFLRLLVIQGVDMPEVLSAVEPLRRKHHLVSARIAPKAVVGSPGADAWEQGLEQYGYRWDKVAVAPTKTILVDLTAEEDEMLARMESKTRYNIRLSQRRGVTTQIATGEDLLKEQALLDQFAAVLQQNFQRLKMKAPSIKFLERICQAFGDNYYVVFAHLSNGEPGAVASYILYGDTISYQMNGSTEAGRHDFAANAAVWAGMLAGKRRGCSWLDFDGIADERYKEDEEWEGFTRFKSGFGGEVITFMGSFKKNFPLL